MHAQPGIRKVAFIGNYLPRQCGIATFTTSLCESFAAQSPETQSFAVPVTDTGDGYDYPPRVRFEIREKDLGSYERAAGFLNMSGVDVVSLQHEYGIFGGGAGGYILILIKSLKMPLVTTLHTVLQNPNEQQRRVMEQITSLSDRIIVMTSKASEILRSVYGVNPLKVTLIPHGIIDLPFIDPNFYKDLFGVEGKTVLLTFGLLGPDKGIEYAIRAMPAILEKRPDTVYMVLGATHPSLLRHEGEAYRLSLQYLAEDLGVEDNVIFHNRFVSTEELKEFIGAADIYLTPYLNETQITSGALAYSFGAGKAVVSTPYWHAAELLSGGRGALVPFRNSGSIAAEVLRLIENEAERHAMRKNAYLMGREMVWSNVAFLYRKAFDEARLSRLSAPPRSAQGRVVEVRSRVLPKIKLDHLFRISDATGVFRHAIYNVPDFTRGYTTDSAACALILAVLLEDAGEGNDERLGRLASTCLAFINNAFDESSGRFRGVLGFDRVWRDEPITEESHARALWALGTCIGRSRNEGFQNLADQLFEKALPVARDAVSHRAWALTLMAVHEYFRRFDGDRFVNQCREALAGKLYNHYGAIRSEESSETPRESGTVNSRLPHALILSGRWLGNADMLKAGLDSLRWLLRAQTSPGNSFRAVPREYGAAPRDQDTGYDQRPAEAYATVAACLEAYRTTQDPFWYGEGRKAFEWFLGRNDVGLSLYDSKTGGCRDALQVDRVNHNEGAEASLSFYLSLVEMQAMESTLASLGVPVNL